MKRRTSLFLLSVFCFGVVVGAFAAEPAALATREQSYPIPQHGKLVLTFPADWQESARSQTNDLPPTIRLTPATGEEFKVLITPLWSQQKDPSYNAPEKIRGLIAKDLTRMLPGAVEQQTEIKMLQGAAGSGFYFQLTDKAPPKGSYPYAIRAGLGVGDLLLSVTVLAKTQDSQALTEALKVLQGARQVY